MSVVTFEELKTKYQSKLTNETEVTCRVIAKLKEGYLVDVNEEWEGFIPNSHMPNGNGTETNYTEPFKALIISGPDKSDRYTVSPKVFKEKSIWENLQKLKDEDTPFKVTISKAIKGGVEIYIDTLRAFLPGRYLRLPGLSPENWTGQEISVFVEELNYKEKKIILNHKKAVDFEKQRKGEIAIQKLKEGDIVEAPVLRVADFGVFVDLGGLDGLIPASELTWGRFTHPKDIVKPGQIIQARIFRIEKENQRVALSIKQLLGEPWDQITSDWQTGTQLQGKVISEATFGLFVELKPGIEALLHNSEIPEGIEKPKVGSLVLAKIIKLDIDQRKIGLSLKNIDYPNVRAIHELPQQEEQPSSTNPEEDFTMEAPQLSLENLALSNLDQEEKEEQGDKGEKEE